MAEATERILAEILDSGATRARVGGFDVDGILRGKSISISKLRSALETGFGFCDVIFGWDVGDVLYDNARFTGWHTGYPDALARIEPSTYRRIPWEENVPFFLVDFYERDGRPLAVSPRQALRRVIARAESLGFAPVMGAEYEFFFFQETPHTLREKGFRHLRPLSPGMFGYSAVRASANSALVSDLVRWLKGFDCELEGIHTETGPGVYEAAIAPDEALRAADKAALFKTAVKEIAARHGLVVTFMAKWNADLPGCGGHLHQSLWRNGENAFAGEGGAPSETLRQYAAGLLATLPEFAALYLPTANSYKRMVPGTWAPVSATWGTENRTTAIRVIPGLTPKAARVEMRVTGADINPYVAIAASLAGGLYGIERGLALGPECRGNAYEARDAPPLPRSLEAAIPALARSAVAREYLGEAFVEHYLATRDWELRQWQRAVTDWELARYFEAI